MLYFSLLLALSCLFFMFLTMIVILSRRRTEQSLGNVKNDNTLERAVRAHGNFVEITPFCLASLWLLMQCDVSESLVIIVGALFFIGRISHAASLLYLEERIKTFKFRIFGMMTSFLLIVTGSLTFIIEQI